ncbi:hypothetical protein SASPL_145632 [Salvia splendens]|uniref:Uncharacterized protein n=1 Tax=Salvia splendens TaxID=180675 RepID=A0A8X8WJF8_SALSN|nr:hypothetical protein SASPL_145632 [Salvia splendens]
MNENDQVVHYMDNSYSYPVSEGYVDYYSGASTAPLNYLNFAPMHDQESIYWSMHMNSYKYGQPNPEGFYYGLYDDNDLPPRMDSNRRVWEYSSMATTEDPITVDIPPEQSVVSEVHSIPEESVVSEVHSIPEERLPNDQDAANDEVAWQDDINPDTMTYEELLDLGEAVGTQNRGLSQELIDLLPTSKHKSGGIFSRKKSEERCGIKEGTDKSIYRVSMLTTLIVAPSGLASTRFTSFQTCPVCNTVWWRGLVLVRWRRSRVGDSYWYGCGGGDSYLYAEDRTHTCASEVEEIHICQEAVKGTCTCTVGVEIRTCRVGEGTHTSTTAVGAIHICMVAVVATHICRMAVNETRTCVVEVEIHTCRMAEVEIRTCRVGEGTHTCMTTMGAIHICIAMVAATHICRATVEWTRTCTVEVKIRTCRASEAEMRTCWAAVVVTRIQNFNGKAFVDATSIHMEKRATRIRSSVPYVMIAL